ncbi:MAG: phage protein GemA/Gp16 family protein [Thermodesulfobacteriota bacterium]
MLDHKKLAVIHIVKKELGLADQEYRDTLERVAGVRSAKDLDEAGFSRLMRHFAKSRHFRERPDGITFRQRYYIRHLLEELDWDQAHFRNFLRKYYRRDAVEQCSRREAIKVIESLRHIIAHRRSEAGEPAATRQEEQS